MMSARSRNPRTVFLLALVLVLGLVPAATAGAQEDDPEDWDNFVQEVLNDDVQEAMALAVLPDGRVLHNARSGDPESDDTPAPFRLYDPETGESPVIAELPVYSFSEYGAQGIALDPDFEENGWIYVYYTPPHPEVPEGEAPYDSDDPSTWEDYAGVNQLSRFDFVDGDDPTIDLDSEQVLLEVPTNLGLCCHVGGDIDFDSEGNLYLSTGDDTSPFESDEFTPIDERDTRNPGFDAQRTSANTASLGGKLLRITPTDDGSYTVPDDNMFNSGAYDDLFPGGEYDPELALPEIYVMGLRNPFRFSIDPVTDIVYLADYGPDAPEADPERGPEATTSWHILAEPANVGWPYCIGNNFAFVEYDFATGESGEPFDCDNPVNESPNNTGLTELPPTRPADVWNFNTSVAPEFPELGEGGGAPMGGPVYRYDDDLDSDVQFPEFYDGTAFFYEWNHGYIKQFVLDDSGTSLEEIRDFVPDWEFFAPMDMEFGPDGAMYLLEYGGGFFVEAPEARLTKISFDPDAESPGQPTPPQVVTATLDPAEPDGEEGWYVSPVTLTLESDDETAELQWRLSSDDDWETWTEPVTIDTDGVHEIEYRAFWVAEDANADNGEDNEVPDTVTSELVNFVFEPDELTVAEGGTVIFEHVQGAHNVIIYDENEEQVGGQEQVGGWDTYEFVAEEAGSYTFVCIPHAPGMSGTLEVVGTDGGEGREGDASDTYQIDLQLDQTAPETTATATSAPEDDPDAVGGAAIDEAMLTLAATDETSGVAETHLRIAGDDGFDIYEDPVVVPVTDEITFEYRSLDVAGNAEDWGTITVDASTVTDPPPGGPGGPGDPGGPGGPGTPGGPDGPSGPDYPSPTRVESGTGGLLTSTPAAWVGLLMLLGLLAIAAPIVQTVRRPRADA